MIFGPSLRSVTRPKPARMMVRIAAAAVTLAACSPQDVVDSVNERAAKSVVVSVVSAQYPAPQADVAADCLLAVASPAEREALARDVGNRPGTVTEANARALAARPAAADCVARAGLQAVRV
jgi:hypothetical protein